MTHQSTCGGDGGVQGGDEFAGFSGLNSRIVHPYWGPEGLRSLNQCTFSQVIPVTCPIIYLELDDQQPSPTGSHPQIYHPCDSCGCQSMGLVEGNRKTSLFTSKTMAFL